LHLRKGGDGREEKNHEVSSEQQKKKLYISPAANLSTRVKKKRGVGKIGGEDCRERKF